MQIDIIVGQINVPVTITDPQLKRILQLEKFITNSGPVLQKLIQQVAEDFPEGPLKTTLNKSKDNCERMDEEHFEKISLKLQGYKIEKLDPKPEAVASIAQVHKCRFMGKDVAMKVQKPMAIWLM